MQRKLVLSIFCAITSITGMAQESIDVESNIGSLEVPFVLYNQGKVFYNNEYIWSYRFPTIYVFAPLKFKNQRERQQYNRLVNNVKRTLPIARMVKQTILETHEYLETLPTARERSEHIKRVEKGLKEQYTPLMKSLTYSQGKLLIKLIDRECNQSSYDLVKAFMGSFKAIAYNTFASIFGANLKKGYDAENDDKLIERVVLMIESGDL